MRRIASASMALVLALAIVGTLSTLSVMTASDPLAGVERASDTVQPSDQSIPIPIPITKECRTDRQCDVVCQAVGSGVCLDNCTCACLF